MPAMASNSIGGRARSFATIAPLPEVTCKTLPGQGLRISTGPDVPASTTIVVTAPSFIWTSILIFPRTNKLPSKSHSGDITRLLGGAEEIGFEAQLSFPENRAKAVAVPVRVEKNLIP